MKFDRRLAALFGATALTAFAAPAFAATITLSNIVVPIDEGTRLTIPTIEVTDGNLDQSALEAIFKSNIETAAGTLQTLDAASIVIPEMTLTTTVPAMAAGGQPMTSSATYRDFELTGVTDGVAASMRLGSVESGDSGGLSKFTIGESTSTLFSIAGIFNFYGFGSASSEFLPIYRDFVMRDMALSGPGYKCDIGDTTNAEFLARPLNVSMSELYGAVVELEAADKAGTPPSQHAISTLVNYVVDLLTAFRSKPFIVDGFTCDSTSDTGEAVKIASGALNIGGFEPGIYPELVLQNFRLEMPSKDHVALENFTWKQIDFAPTIASLQTAAGALNPAWLEANWRNLIPVVQGFSFSGLDFDIPDPETKQQIAGSVGNFDLSLASYLNGIPTQISSVTTDLKFPLPQTGEGSELRAMGIEILDIDSEVTLHWDEAGKSIAVDNLEVVGADMGRLSISGILGNAGPELFDSKTDVQTVAALGLTVRELTIDVENQGLVPFLIAMMAAEQKVAPAEFHVALAGMAQALPLGILGATPDALALSQALASFLTGTPQLTVTLTSVDPAGISLPEFMAAQENPALLKDKVSIAASVSGDPVPFEWPAVTAPAAATKTDGKVNG